MIRSRGLTAAAVANVQESLEIIEHAVVQERDVLIFTHHVDQPHSDQLSSQCLVAQRIDSFTREHARQGKRVQQGRSAGRVHFCWREGDEFAIEALEMPRSVGELMNAAVVIELSNHGRETPRSSTEEHSRGQPRQFWRRQATQCADRQRAEQQDGFPPGRPPHEMSEHDQHGREQSKPTHQRCEEARSIARKESEEHNGTVHREHHSELADDDGGRGGSGHECLDVALTWGRAAVVHVPAAAGPPPYLPFNIGRRPARRLRRRLPAPAVVRRARWHHDSSATLAPSCWRRGEPSRTTARAFPAGRSTRSARIRTPGCSLERCGGQGR
jgi:hypothetical protein